MESGTGSSNQSLQLDDLLDDDSGDVFVRPSERSSDGAWSGGGEQDSINFTDNDDDDDGKNHWIDGDDDGDHDLLRQTGGRTPEQMARDAQMYVQ
jgi:hypothetical protein